MEHNSAKIYLITPSNNKSKYKTMIAFADTPEEARAASAEINPMKEISAPSDESPLIDPVYLDKNLSNCEKIDIEITITGKEGVHIQHLGHEYYLTKNYAKPLHD